MKPILEKKSNFTGFENGRVDGRDFEEFRPVCFRTNVLTSTPGSAYCSLGSEDSATKTEVIVSIDGPKPSQRVAAEKAELCVNIQFSPMCRKVYDSNAPELRRLENDVCQCFESAILLNEYPKSRIEINVVILQDDGELFSAIVNSASLAVASAGIGMKDLVSAVTVYAIAPQKNAKCSSPLIVVDMNNEEEALYRERKTELSWVTLGLLARTGGVAFIRSVGADLSEETHEMLLGVGEHSCQELADEMRASLKEDQDEEE
eukprot:GDKJ01021931.1.p1 GENE.GDKJ01021931.1~~GDKJ01021931.1.p1  ORF type:complete len:261 (-),score=57.51 GDKJ01021931.1:42-824(-)